MILWEKENSPSPITTTERRTQKRDNKGLYNNRKINSKDQHQWNHEKDLSTFLSSWAVWCSPYPFMSCYLLLLILVYPVFSWTQNFNDQARILKVKFLELEESKDPSSVLKKEKNIIHWWVTQKRQEKRRKGAIYSRWKDNSKIDLLILVYQLGVYLIWYWY